MLKYMDLLHQLSLTEKQSSRLYVLIDAAQQDDVIEQWLKIETSPRVRSLFEGTVESSLPLRVSPLLVNLSLKAAQDMSPSIEEWLIRSSMVSVLCTPLTTDAIIEHIQKFLEAKLPSGEVALFRLFDPQVAKLIPRMLTQENYEKLMQPITAWWLSNDEGSFEALLS